MTAKKRRAHRRLPPIPLSELPMLKALLALAGPLSTGKTAVRPTKGDPKTELATLTRTIADKLQVLALRRPRALIIVAQIVDKLLDQQLEALLDVKREDRSPRKTADGVGRTRRDPSHGSR